MMKRKRPDLIKVLQSADVTFGNDEYTAIALRKFGGYVLDAAIWARLALADALGCQLDKSALTYMGAQAFLLWF